MRPSPRLRVGHEQPSLHPLAEVTHTHVHVTGHKLQHRVDLVAQVRYGVERGDGGYGAGAPYRSAQSVDDRHGGVDCGSRHDAEGKTGWSSQELIKSQKEEEECTEMRVKQCGK